jgi:Reverse transcriptase (RNA-dependent DNA polymerase)
MKAKFINAALKHSYVFERWKTVVNATIEKIPGRPLLHKLRVIHLIESDINLTAGIQIGRRLIKRAMASGLMSEEQFGSLPGRKAIDALALKHMILAIARLSSTNMASFDNDAKSCFDRIVMLLASLIAQRYGMNQKAMELFLKTLASVKYHVKTKTGISESYYTTTEKHTIHGPGQGGRGSPAIWAIISCLLMECMPEQSTGIELIDPQLLTIIKLYTSGFVDDVTLWIGNLLRSLKCNETPTMILEETAEAAQWWEALLHASGGKLELDKCFYYLVYWVFDEEGVPRLMAAEEYPTTVTIRDSATNKPVNITPKSSLEAHKTLGAMECPSGDNSAEVARLHEKAKGLGQRIATASFTAFEANIVRTTRIDPGRSGKKQICRHLNIICR